MKTKTYECKKCNMVNMTKEDTKEHFEQTSHKSTKEVLNYKDRTLEGWSNIILQRSSDNVL